MAEYGSAHGTLRKDEVAYRHWVFFAQEMGFDPLLTSAQVRDHPEHVSVWGDTLPLPQRDPLRPPALLQCGGRPAEH